MLDTFYDIIGSEGNEGRLFTSKGESYGSHSGGGSHTEH